MTITTEIGGQPYTFRLDKPVAISVPLDMHGPQPSLFGVPGATAQPYQGDGWVGSTQLGGSCNFNDVRVNAHCNGTHTETLSHIIHTLHPIGTELQEILVPATVVTIHPWPYHDQHEYYIHGQPLDRMLTRENLLRALAPFPPTFRQAIIIRTHPHTGAGPTDAYPAPDGYTMPPYPTHELVQELVTMGTRHLVLDVPSIDRLLDQGALANHRIFWNLPTTGHEAGPAPRHGCTITEFAYPPATVPDGPCLLNIQVPHWHQDAAPSRLWVFGAE